MTRENIEKATKNIYENIIKKNLKFVKLKSGYYGITLYSNKILISNIFIEKIKTTSKKKNKDNFVGCINYDNTS